MRGYDTHVEFSGKSGTGSRGVYDLNGDGKVRVYEDAFKMNGQEDATSLMATIDHEHNHFQYNDKWIKEAKEHGFNELKQDEFYGGKIKRSSGVAFVEARNYNLGLAQASQYGYSEDVIKYLEVSRDNNLTWQSKLIILRGF